VVGRYEHGNKPPCSIKGGEFLDSQNEWEIFHKNALLIRLNLR
jgi:hypothetical protein